MHAQSPFCWLRALARSHPRGTGSMMSTFCMSVSTRVHALSVAQNLPVCSHPSLLQALMHAHPTVQSQPTPPGVRWAADPYMLGMPANRCMPLSPMISTPMFACLPAAAPSPHARVACQLTSALLLARWQLHQALLHQALMHANSSSMENLQVLDNNQLVPGYPPSMSRSSEQGASSLVGGSSPPESVQGTSCGASPRLQGLRDGGGAIPPFCPDDLPPGTIGLRSSRPTIGEEGEDEEIAQEAGSPRSAHLPDAIGIGHQGSSATGCSSQDRATTGSAGPVGLMTSASCDVGDMLQPRGSIGDIPSAVHSPQGRRRTHTPSENGSVTLVGMPSMERRRGGLSSVILPGGGAGMGRGSVFGGSSYGGVGASEGPSVHGAPLEQADSPNQQRASPTGDFPPSEANETLCGICFDHNCLLRIAGCKHAMCDECAHQLLGTMVNAPLPCPFCRCVQCTQNIVRGST
ncbi:hypothetical protein DUNSADRAFT_9981 [Dunaliella salina]|uniref:RING-type domain-containing protein n=1 Tax=Dunaliella salina TaxID=3046 RepID=A0ABZ3KWU0_DUNSA|nr:hypothetical protein DUNSADRAFT_9981 [Dunaliella salina]|eukprot:KAF5833638.1 hypothetical protein DUNSADRAFT_9981 [Dunaliella salina]